MRLTSQRLEILESLSGRTDHPSAEEIFMTLRERGSRISLPTVYRCLRALARERQILELKGEGPDRFDPDTRPHYHFYCLTCNKVFDAPVPYRPEFDKAKLEGGFVVLGHELNLFGMCPDCSKSKEEGRTNESYDTGKP